MAIEQKLDQSRPGGVTSVRIRQLSKKILGAIMGVWIWMKWDLRLRTLWLSDALDSWLGLVLVVAIVSTAVGALSAWLRHRFDPRVFFYTWWL